MSGTRQARLALFVAVAALGWARSAAAEVVLYKSDDGATDFYTEGRVGGFFEAVTGQTQPTGYDQSGNLLHTIGDGGIVIGGVNPTLPMGGYGQGTMNVSRVRSGFMSNVLAFGIRRKITPATSVRGYISIWADIETENERAYYPLVPDAREGFLKVEGPAGGLLVGRSLTLFSRGATEIDFLYGHRYGVGNPAGFQAQGPSGGFVGYGVLAATFAAGIVYNTPSVGGLVLTVGYFDPDRFVGLYWERTEWGRAEAELTYDRTLGSIGRIHLFANGAFQKVYDTGSARSADVWGGGAGGRLELSIVRLGLATHYGQGLGFSYALDGSNAIVEQANTQALRKFDGFYAQSMVVLGRVDVSLGAGVTRVHEVDADVDPKYFNPTTGQAAVSVLKQRIGMAAGVVYHFTDYLHLDADYFRASAEWWLGEKQVVNTFNAGMTFTW
jgi:hypothetical protein